jgi:DNA gyrase subunit A
MGVSFVKFKGDDRVVTIARNAELPGAETPADETPPDETTDVGEQIDSAESGEGE